MQPRRDVRHVLSILLLSWGLAAPGATQGITLEATTKAGATVRGTWTQPAVTLETEFGRARVRADRIAALTLDETPECTTLGGHRLRGTLAFETLVLLVDGQPRTLRLAELSRVRRILDGRPFGTASFAGRWSTTFGPLELEQEGDAVKGTYSHSKLPLRGGVQDGVLSVTYRAGKASFRLVDDGARIRGEYTAPNGQKGFWGGYPIRQKVAPLTPGTLTSGQTKSWLNYHVRAPRSFRKGHPPAALALLHDAAGPARKTLMEFVERWPELADRFVLVGFDGEKLSPKSRPGAPVYDYSFEKFSGPMRGHSSRFRESPALLAEAIAQLRNEQGLAEWYLVGAGDGGSLAYALAMFYPTAVRGVFSSGATMLNQYRPQAFRDASTRTRQQRVAFAIGGPASDPAYRALIDAGFPAVRRFAPGAKAGIEWLVGIGTSDAVQLLAFAHRQIDAGRFRDAAAALQRREQNGASRAADLWQKIDEEARPVADRLLAAIQQNADNAWVEPFLAFRRTFGLAPCAAPVLTAYANLRARHARDADRLYAQARRAEDPAIQQVIYRDIVRKHYASKWYAYARDALQR